jgi:hypothetical protein
MVSRLGDPAKRTVASSNPPSSAYRSQSEAATLPRSTHAVIRQIDKTAAVGNVRARGAMEGRIRMRFSNVSTISYGP